MILVPFRTDAATREFPYGTVAVFLANVAVAIFAGFEHPDWTLEFGHIQPFEWFAGALSHADLLHLAVNMSFLWAFGFVVEALLGWRRFLGLYLVFCAVEGFVTQLLMLGSDAPGTLGASGVITALMAVAWLCCPRSRVEFFIWLFPYWIFQREFRVSTICIVMMGYDLLIVLLTGFALSSALLHTGGAAMGFAAVLFLLKKKWVESDVGERSRRVRVADLSGPVRPVGTLAAIRERIDEGAPLDADERAVAAGRELPREDLERLIDGLLAAERGDRAVPRLEELIRRFPARAPLARLRLARELLGTSRPRGALEQLEEVDPRALARKWRDLHADLERRARAALGSNRLELE